MGLDRMSKIGSKSEIRRQELGVRFRWIKAGGFDTCHEFAKEVRTNT